MPHLATGAGLIAGIGWDPFIRGILILVIFLVMFPGSVYLVLSTDIGGRVGILVAGACITGMLCMLAILWPFLSSTAAIGRPNSWRALEVVTGDWSSQVTINGVRDFPVNDIKGIAGPLAGLNTKHWFWPWQSCPDNGWHQLAKTRLTDTESTADVTLAPSASAPAAKTQFLTSPFSAATDYMYIDGYEKDANSGCLFSINRHKIYVPLARNPHYVVDRVLPVLPPPPGLSASQLATLKPQPDYSKPFTYVILDRNLGTVRQPQFVVAVSAGLTFLVICYILHKRDQEIWAKQEAEKADKAGAGAR